VRAAVPAALDGERIDRMVAFVTGCSRAEAAMLIGAGKVRLDGRVVQARATRVVDGEVVELEWPPPGGPLGLEPDPSVTVPIVYEDADVIVVDKPAGLTVHPGAGTTVGTLAHGLLARYPELADVGSRERPGIVHRLDKGTSGLLMVARGAAAHASLTGQLAARTVGRRYLTLVWGHLETTAGLIDAPVGRSGRAPTRMAVSTRGRDARTSYDVVAEHPAPAPTSLLRCRLETGRTHQIRVHLAAIGHPVVGDARYGGRRESLSQLGRPFLHAEHLSFDQPTSGDRLEFDSALPSDLRTMLDELGRRSAT
jgi:23S rRNA pseudouridine1911/1915/1917 synthase